MCVGKVTILYQGHKLHILVDYYRNKLKLIVDSERVADFEEIEDWAKVRETPTKHMKLLLTDVQVEVISDLIITFMFTLRISGCFRYLFITHLLECQ